MWPHRSGVGDGGSLAGGWSRGLGVVVAAAVLGMGGLAVLGGWRGVGRFLLATGCGIARARFAVLAGQALSTALDEAPGAVPGALAAELLACGRVVTCRGAATHSASAAGVNS